QPRARYFRMNLNSTGTSPSFRLVCGRVDLVLRDLGGDAPTGEAADLGATADVAARLAHGTPPSFRLVCGRVGLVLRDLGGDAPTGEAADLGATADVAARLAQRPAEVTLLEGGRQFAELLGERARQIDA